MIRRALATGLAVAFSLAVFPSLAPLEGQSGRQRVLIRTSKPYANIEAAIGQLGGKVTHSFDAIDALAADVPESALSTLRGLLPAGAISKDEWVSAPAPVRESQERGAASADDAELPAEDPVALDAAEIVSLATANPAAYLVNNAITHASELHANNILGQNVVVAVIDSGIRPGFPHLEIGGSSIVGCDDFVLDANGCSHFGNNGHGTFVAGMISANVNFTFGATSVLRNSVLTHAPGAINNPPANTRIPMIGSAPLSQIYALRVFGPTGGAPTSRILAAMERAIELRRQFDSGTGGANISVVNMSLGGSTVYAGRDLFDTMIHTLVEADIVPVIAASNNGPALLTTGSPGSSIAALTVGAASLTHNERILRDVQFGLGIGVLYRPFAGHQTAYFSSRGPNADGRPDPDVVANGFANYGQGTGATTNSITLGSGTSYASPSVAGVAALLRQAFPDATALQIRNAIIAGANPAIITDGSGEFDQGSGMVDAVASHNLLAAGGVSDSLEKPHRAKKKVEKNLEHFAGLQVLTGNVSLNSGLLLPGQHHTILYDVKPGATKVAIDITNFQKTGPGNTLFGDDILLAVHTAKLSSVGDGDYRFFSFTTGGHFEVANPEPGIMRVTLYGDWTNTGTVSVDAAVSQTPGPLPAPSASGNLRNGAADTFLITVPAGATSLDLLLRWQEDWSRYPGADLDLLLVNPSGTVVIAGATSNSPERVTIANPVVGTWQIVVDAFEVHLNKANYKLTVTLDGNLVKLK
jgi:subtilisin family serine protease